jgi:hypothetical protein
VNTFIESNFALLFSVPRLAAGAPISYTPAETTPNRATAAELGGRGEIVPCFT